MEMIPTVLELMKRQAELEEGLRQPGGIRVTENSEIYALRERLQRYPQAVTAILQAARLPQSPGRNATAKGYPRSRLAWNPDQDRSPRR
jgi:hypothetical protein